MGIGRQIHKVYLASALLLSSFFAVAQNGQNEFLEAKRLYGIQDFRAAADAFQDLAFDRTFGAYARFYLGLSQYKVGNVEEAVIAFQDVLEFHPNWENSREALYWLTKIAFENGEPEGGLQYLELYELKTTSSALSNAFVPLYLKNEPVPDLIELHNAFPDNAALANLLAKRISQQPFLERDQELLESLINRFEIDPEVFIDSDLQNVFKSSYNVAVVLPFMFESLEDPGRVLRNNLVTDFYQGMELAVTDLEEDSIFLKLYPFDTERSEEKTRQLLPEIGKSDVIVGPLLPSQIELVKGVSESNKINMINPLSNNEQYIENNPLAFLFRAGYSTMARKLAEYVIENDSSDNIAIYFSGNDRDSLFASVYHQVMVDSGKTVVDFRSIDELDAKALLDTLTDQYEVFLPKEEADSIIELEEPGRFIKFRRMRVDEEENLAKNEELQKMWFPEVDEEGVVINPDNPVKMLAYEMKFKVRKDSIGHFMIATRSNTIANNIISAVAAREDSTGVYGYGNWFDFRVVNYDLMELLEVTLAMPEYLNKDTYRYSELSSRFSAQYATVPSEYHFHGYEFTLFLGKALKRYGKYFQNGFYTGKIYGYLSEGIKFQGANDNQIVPIVKMRNFSMEVVKSE